MADNADSPRKYGERRPRIMRAIGKVKGKSGVSMVLALVVMMAVSILCVSALKISSSAPQTAYAQQDFEQSYLSAASAAKLVKSILTDPTSAKAVEILGALDTATEKTFALQLNASGANTSIVNLPVMQVTLKKAFNATTEEASVDISFSEGTQTGWTVQTLSATTSAAPVRLSSISLSIKTDVDIWRDGAGAIVLAKLYPRSYTGALVDPPASISSRPDYAPDVYTHTYKEASNDNTSKIKWTVIWLDGDGTELERATYLDGEQEPQRKTSTTPTKAGDDRWWSYQPFANQWTSTTKGSVKTYTPIFEGAVRKYYVTWLDAAGAPIAGATNTLNNSDGTDPTFPGTNLTKDETDVYSYTFDNWLWDGKYGDTGSIFTKTYTPNFTATAKQYTAIWLNANGTELERQEYTLEDGKVKPTTPPTKSPATEDDKYSYTFDTPIVWTGSYDEATRITTYTPQFTRIAKEYTVRWLNMGGNALATANYTPATDATFPSASEDTINQFKNTLAHDNGHYYYDAGDSFYDLGNLDSTVTWTQNQTGLVIDCTPQYSTVAKTARTVTWRGGAYDDEQGCTATYCEYSYADSGYPGHYEEPQLDAAQVVNSDNIPTRTVTEWPDFVEYRLTGWDPQEVSSTQIYYNPVFTLTPKCSQAIWYDKDGATVLYRKEIINDTVPASEEIPNENKPTQWWEHTSPTWNSSEETSGVYRIVKYTLLYEV